MDVIDGGYLLNVVNISVLECGASFTSKLEGMFRDMELSKDVMVQFKQVGICIVNHTWKKVIFSDYKWFLKKMQYNFYVSNNLIPILLVIYKT